MVTMRTLARNPATIYLSRRGGSQVKVAVVVGNPKPASRTLEAAMLLAGRIDGDADPVVIDVVELGSGLFGWGDDAAKAAIASVQESDLAVFASPTYKASYTGVLKIFLDLMPTNALAGVVGIPLMLGAGPGHALAPELCLKPVLVELGATCPTKGLYILDSVYTDGVAIEEWAKAALPQIAASTASHSF
jgi:FMN reductase